MEVSAEFDIIQAVAADGKKPDMSRPVLAHVSLQAIEPFAAFDGSKTKYNALLIAANGFILAVVPATITDADVPGLLSPEVFRTARKVSGKSGVLSFTAGFDSVSFPDGATQPRTLHDPMTQKRTDRDAQYPDYNRIVPRRDRLVGQALFGVNPELLARVAAAIGSKNGVRLLGGEQGDSQPVLVDGVFSGNDNYNARVPVAPYGVIMPMHMTDRFRLQVTNNTLDKQAA